MEEIYREISAAMFKNADELYLNKEKIREEYTNFNTKAHKEIYKWWFFCQLSIIRNPLKELLWEYLNGLNVDEKLDKEYELFCEKRNKIDYTKIDKIETL